MGRKKKKNTHREHPSPPVEPQVPDNNEESVDSRADRRHIFIGIIALTVIIAVPYLPILNNGFINFDDDVYITDNSMVKTGLTLESVRWAFTSFHTANWHPLTWLSHMCDYELFGLNPAGHHAMNLLLHVVSSIILLLAFTKLTNQLLLSFIVAVLFGIHPAHVESVAWAAERKDVLSTLFWMLTLWIYACYARQKSILKYISLVATFGMGLMAKPMLVTLPFVLLLLDYWPLNRVSIGSTADVSENASGHTERQSILSLVVEKIPLFILTIGSCVITFIAQKHGGAVASLTRFTFVERFANSMIAYLSYVGKAIWPTNLAVFYPHHGSNLSFLKLTLASLGIIAISVVFLWGLRKYRYLAVGWLWFIGTLVPVIGIIQVGEQGMADRYTYIPFVGLFIIACWFGADLIRKFACPGLLLKCGIPALMLVLAVGTWRQSRHWQTSGTLFQHTVEVTGDNYLARSMLGLYYTDTEPDKALLHFAETLRIRPTYSKAYYSIAKIMEGKENIPQAIENYQLAVRTDPSNGEAHNNLGLLLYRTGQAEKAIEHFRSALNIRSDYTEAHNNLGSILLELGKVDTASQHIREAIRLKPSYVTAHFNLGILYYRDGDTSAAISQYEKVIELKPDHAAAHYNLGNIYLGQSRYREAAALFSEALRLRPNFKEAETNLANAQRYLK